MFNPLNLVTKFIKSSNQKELGRIGKIVSKINLLEDEFKKLDDLDFPKKTKEYIEQIKQGKTLDELLPEAFALVIVNVSPITYPDPWALSAIPVIAPLASTPVILTVAELPDADAEVAIAVPVAYPVPPDNVPALRASIPPRLGLVIVKVSPIK